MSGKRSRGHLAVKQLQQRAPELTSAVEHSSAGIALSNVHDNRYTDAEASKPNEIASPMTPEKKRKSSNIDGMRSPVQQLYESPGVAKIIDEINASISFEEKITKSIRVFKTLDNIIATFHSRKKTCSLDAVVEAFEFITNFSVTLDDIALILNVWPDAYQLNWKEKPESSGLSRSFELVLSLPLVPDAHSKSLPTGKMTRESDSGGQTTLARDELIVTPVTESDRVEYFSEKLITFANKIAQEGKTVLPIDLSVIPSCPQYTSVGHLNEFKRTKVSCHIESNNSITTDAPESPGVSDTLEALRERAKQRGNKLLEVEAVDKHKRQQIENNRLLALLPSMTDTIRSLCLRKNRTKMVKKDLCDDVACAMHLKRYDVNKCLDLIYQCVPEFITIFPEDSELPSTVKVNTSVSYKETRAKVVDFVHQNTVVLTFVA